MTGAPALPKAPCFRLDGARALVTGAGRGLGFAAAAALAQAGASVTLCARSRGELEAAAEAIRAAGGLAEALPLDVNDLSAVRTVFGSRPAFDVVLNNAGTNRPKPFSAVTEDDYEAVLDLNLKAVVFVCQAAATQMIEAGVQGSIIMMSSQMGHVGAAGRTLYCASKWGLEGFSKALALELAPHNIRVNTVAPTFIETDMTRPMLEDPGFKSSVLSKIKLGRLGRAEDVTGAVIFLASRASSMMTGTSIVVDGGWTAD